jgi:polar amino acid transport system permease protein
MSGWTTFLRDLAEQWPLVVDGLWQTLLLAATASVCGFVGGVVVFRLTLARSVLVRRATQAYMSFFIGTPLIVLLFLMYYGLPPLGLRMAPFTVAAIGFALNVAAYNAAYMTSAYNGIDPLELEAARAQGFDDGQVFRLVTLPQVLRLSVPSLTNQVSLNLKDSTVAFLIQYTEFFARIQEIAASNFRFFQAYLFAALVYLALVSVVGVGARALERRLALPAA